MTAADLDRLMEIAAGLEQAPHWPRDVYEAVLGADIPRHIALLAETPGAVAGFAVARLTPPEAELETIAVAAAFQRRGVARQIFSVLADKLLRAGVSVVLLEARASNYPALEFYRSRGFVETGHRVHYYADPVEDAALMRLGLGSPEGAEPES
jgi:ribosomal-protein-alanine N-acetyltransferase